MVKLHNFLSAYQHYQQQKISFRVLQDQAVIMLGLCDNPHTNAMGITQGDIAWLMEQEEATQSYDVLLGGKVYICETEADLLQIHGCDLDWAATHEGRWPNVTDKPMSWDICKYLDEPIGNPQWVVFLLCWNNAGGPTYYVHMHLWVQARVAEHITATN